MADNWGKSAVLPCRSWFVFKSFAHEVWKLSRAQTLAIWGRLAMSIRILLVDDFEPWRFVVCLMIQKERGLKIIGEVSDGLAAIHNANELKPDLILLDIGLPKLNGIAAARKIRTLAPKSKILFLTQESSTDVVREALGIGTGFGVKEDACKDLLPAIRAVALGKQFLSSKLNGHTFSESTGVLVSAGLKWV
jgi:DNA-binding NarL/FixJ family response regulator